MFYSAVILSGEIRCQSFSGVKRIDINNDKKLVHTGYGKDLKRNP